MLLTANWSWSNRHYEPVRHQTRGPVAQRHTFDSWYFHPRIDAKFQSDHEPFLDFQPNTEVGKAKNDLKLLKSRPLMVGDLTSRSITCLSAFFSSACCCRAYAETPVVKMLISIAPVFGSIIDCFNASRYNRIASSTSSFSTSVDSRTENWRQFQTYGLG